MVARYDRAHRVRGRVHMSSVASIDQTHDEDGGQPEPSGQAMAGWPSAVALRGVRRIPSPEAQRRTRMPNRGANGIHSASGAAASRIGAFGEPIVLS
jgi:hypothetical protein